MQNPAASLKCCRCSIAPANLSNLVLLHAIKFTFRCRAIRLCMMH